MQIPQIPTDSLYKFIAISGLFVSMFFMFLPMYFGHCLMVKIIHVNGELESITVIQKQITEGREMLEENMNLPALKKIETLKESRDDLYKLKAIFVKTKTQAKLIEFYEKQLVLLKKIQFWGIIISNIIMIIGFKLWYLKIQKPLDRKMKSI